MGAFAVWAGTSVGVAVLAGLALAGGWIALRLAGVRRGTTLPDLVLAITFVAILVLTLRDGRVGQPTGSWDVVPFDDLGAALRSGSLRAISFALVDVVTNVILFVPFGAAVALRWPALGEAKAAAVAFALSFGVELVQFLLPLGRTAQTTDVIMNTFGGWLGWLLVTAVRRSAWFSAVVRRRR
jgi:glycopeptide antibiotics resistance protein